MKSQPQPPVQLLHRPRGVRSLRLHDSLLQHLVRQQLLQTLEMHEETEVMMSFSNAFRNGSTETYHCFGCFFGVKPTHSK